jgi:hypothetical protein
MKNSATTNPIAKRPADEGRATSIPKDRRAGLMDSLASGIVANRSQRLFNIDFDFGIEKLAHGGNEWTH